MIANLAAGLLALTALFLAFGSAVPTSPPNPLQTARARKYDRRASTILACMGVALAFVAGLLL